MTRDQLIVVIALACPSVVFVLACWFAVIASKHRRVA